MYINEHWTSELYTGKNSEIGDRKSKSIWALLFIIGFQPIIHKSSETPDFLTIDILLRKIRSKNFTS